MGDWLPDAKTSRTGGHGFLTPRRWRTGGPDASPGEGAVLQQGKIQLLSVAMAHLGRGRLQGDSYFRVNFKTFSVLPVPRFYSSNDKCHLLPFPEESPLREED